MASGEWIDSINQMDKSSFHSDTERSAAKSAITSLLARLETPWETVLRLVWLEPALCAALQTCVQADLFSKWKQLGGGAKSTAELASIGGLNQALLERLLRHMATMNALAETAENTYELTEFSSSLGEKGPQSALGFLYLLNGPAFQSLPSYLRTTGYKNPDDVSSGNWQYHTGQKENYFQYLAANADRMDVFQRTMTFYAAQRIPWIDLYPTEQLVDQQNDGRAVVVDVGGGEGHDIMQMRDKHPSLPKGSLVLEDLPSVVETASLQDPAVAVAHDFFSPQPVKGARAYFLHIVLHDWPDKEAIQILETLAAAMEKGYSTVLLYEMVIAPRDPHPLTTASDLTMMALGSAIERTFQMWNSILSAAGLKVRRTWTSPASIESIIEAELA